MGLGTVLLRTNELIFVQLRPKIIVCKCSAEVKCLSKISFSVWTCNCSVEVKGFENCSLRINKLVFVLLRSEVIIF